MKFFISAVWRGVDQFTAAEKQDLFVLVSQKTPYSPQKKYKSCYEHKKDGYINRLRGDSRCGNKKNQPSQGLQDTACNQY